MVSKDSLVKNAFGVSAFLMLGAFTVKVTNFAVKIAEGFGWGEASFDNRTVLLILVFSMVPIFTFLFSLNYIIKNDLFK